LAGTYRETTNVFGELTGNFIGDYKIVESFAHFPDHGTKHFPRLMKHFSRLMHVFRQPVDADRLLALDLLQLSNVDGECRLLLDDEFDFLLDVIAHTKPSQSGSFIDVMFAQAQQFFKTHPRLNIFASLWDL